MRPLRGCEGSSARASSGRSLNSCFAVQRYIGTKERLRTIDKAPGFRAAPLNIGMTKNPASVCPRVHDERHCRKSVCRTWISDIAGSGASHAHVGKPDVIVVVADDVGYADVGSTGSRGILTPWAVVLPL